MRYLLLSILLLTSFSFLTSQTTLRLQGGVSFSDMNVQLGNNTLQQANQRYIGYAAYLGIDYLDKKFFNLATNVGIIQRGGRDSIPFFDANGQYNGQFSQTDYFMDYISLNTLVELKIPIAKVFIPFVSAGPRVEYLVRNHQSLNNLNKNDIVNNFNYGLLLGGGIKFKLNRIYIGARADYYFDFDEVADWKQNNSLSAGDFRNRTITASGFIGFQFNKKAKE